MNGERYSALGYGRFYNGMKKKIEYKHENKGVLGVLQR